MSARKIRNRWWIDFRHAGIRYRRKSPESSRAGAAAYETYFRRQLALGFDPDAPVVKATTFAEFAERWYREYVVPNNRHSEQRTKRSILDRQLLPFFGECGLDEISPKLIESFKAARRAEGYAPKTVNNYLAALGRALSIAEEWGELDRRPKIRLLPVPPQAFDFLTLEESERLLRSMKDTFWRGVVLVAMRTGLRLGELLALDWSDVDLEGSLLTVRRALVRRRLGPPKSNKIRHVPLSEDVKEALRAWPHRRGFVFGQDAGRKHSDQDAMARVLKQACAAAGLRKVGWHVLRHTFASHLVATGAHLKVVQELLGHSDIRVTMRYSHLEPSRLKEFVDRLDRRPLSPAREVSSFVFQLGPLTPTLAPTSAILGQPVGNTPAPQNEKPREYGALRGGPDGNRTRDLLRDREAC